VRDLLTSVGYEIIESVTGEEGECGCNTYDLILMDIQLPGLDGCKRRMD
jgi:CheY-like chemotaxis protein